MAAGRGVLRFQAGWQGLAGLLAADVFAFKIDNIVCAVAEDASRLVFVENNLISIYKNFQGVFYINSQGTAQLNGQDNAAQFIYSSYNTC